MIQEIINNAVLKDKGNLLKKNYKNNWNKDNPTYGYCYIVSEAIYHYGNINDEYKPYCINFKGDIGTHWYLSNGKDVIDFTSAQFPFLINYKTGIRKSFFKGSVETRKGFISKRGYEMAKLLEII